jgi:hypothetical protein
MAMPAAVAEHCTMVLRKGGDGGSQMIVTGGEGRENRAMKLDVKTSK